MKYTLGKFNPFIPDLNRENNRIRIGEHNPNKIKTLNKKTNVNLISINRDYVKIDGICHTHKFFFSDIYNRKDIYLSSSNQELFHFKTFLDYFGYQRFKSITTFLGGLVYQKYDYSDLQKNINGMIEVASIVEKEFGVNVLRLESLSHKLSSILQYRIARKQRFKSTLGNFFF